MRVVAIEPPEPIVTWDEAKVHLRLDDDEEKTFVESLIAAAQGNIDGPNGWLGRSIGVQTLELRSTGLCSPIVTLPFPPVLSIVSASVDGQAVDIGGYEAGDPDFEFPEPLSDADDIRIQYRAGYETVPAPIKAAVLLMVGDLYRFRETVESGQLAAVPMSTTVNSLLAPYRRWTV